MFISLVFVATGSSRKNIELGDGSHSLVEWCSLQEPNPDKSLAAEGTPNEPGVPGVFGT